jgi:hypothetical protein
VNELEIAKLVSTLGSFGLLAYMAVWGLPAIVTAMREELALQRKECKDEREVLHNRIAFLENQLLSNTNRFVGLLTKMAQQHDDAQLEKEKQKTEPPQPPDTTPGGTQP